ncbi:MAG: UDP-N-acetylmuramate dehydrogenase [Candidatus Marinamargulisbacteria bacterium]|jgi:UDP-N-acetylmuramate dehydrogenase
MNIKRDVPLAKLTTFQNVGVAREVITFEDLPELVAFLAQERPFFMLGKGSNTLINPSSETSRFVRLSPKMFASSVDNLFCRIGAGTSVNSLMKLSSEHGMSGFEFMAGVPASVGGMVYMNFGCWGQTISQLIRRVRVLKLSGEDEWMLPEALAFGYRKSEFCNQPWIILEVELNFRQSTCTLVRQAISKNIETRLAKQPLREKTFGSIFKNPEGEFAAKILDDLGYRGASGSHVKLSEKHANFLVNSGDASFSDAMEFLDKVKADVLLKTGKNLDMEVRVVK